MKKNWPEAAMKALLLLALPSAFFFALPLQAQRLYGVAVATGTAVRVSTIDNPGSAVKGKVLGMSGDTLVVRVDNSRQAAFPFDRMQSLEARGGKNRKLGMLIGGGIVGGIGLVFGGIDKSHDRISTGDYIAVIIGNSAIGALLGYALAPAGWEPVPLVRR